MENSGDTLSHEYRHRSNHCPTCNSNLDASSGGSNAPKKGDFSVCAYCGELLVFEDNQCHIKKAEDEDMEKIKTESPDNYSKIILYQNIIRRGLNK